MNPAASFFRKMQSAMDSQAIEVWKMIEYSRSSNHRLRLGEVTLTELNFYMLREFWTKTVYIDTNEPDESRTGADWEWLIGYGEKWLQIRVQAKVIDRNGSFKELGHKPKRSTRLQMDTLIDPPEDEVACHWIPLYVFYTATPPSKAPSPSREYGCSAKLAHKVRNVYSPSPCGRSTLTAASHLKESEPWSNIFSGLVARLEDQNDGKGKILKKGESLRAIIDDLADKKVPIALHSIGDFWTNELDAQECHKSLPIYLQTIIAEHDDSFTSASAARLEVKFTDYGELSEADAVDASVNNSSWIVAEELNKRRLEPTDRPEKTGVQMPPTRTISVQRTSAVQQQFSLPSLVSILDVSKLSFEEGGVGA